MKLVGEFEKKKKTDRRKTRSLRGRFSGKGLMKELKEERSRERGL
jgi:hypothetical protein